MVVRRYGSQVKRQRVQPERRTFPFSPRRPDARTAGLGTGLPVLISDPQSSSFAWLGLGQPAFRLDHRQLRSSESFLTQRTPPHTLRCCLKSLGK